MTDTTTTTEPAKRGRNSAIILTDRMCEKRVDQRDKVYDRKAPGLYISRTASGVTAFNFKFTHPTTGKQCSTKIGDYSPAFGVDVARSKVYAMKAMDPAELVALLSQKQAEKAAQAERRLAVLVDHLKGDFRHFFADLMHHSVDLAPHRQIVGAPRRHAA
ncbi:DUF4102 domain-containing protein [Bradyrhizobium lablabi]|uniref:DUF4102 domain-containing protein n=1 Tax=Bradyrhizobium lablabi TaxID=722472 RepID=UPI001BAE4E99|nr:DUF4102 domain-containing protein [Bradyrhizobium lablabi]MBR0696492.1 DUF4102 domain-containing protein [Bradyrhizobium lablabi]